jgi:hypothetical protein
MVVPRMVTYGPGVRRKEARGTQPRPALGRRPWFAFLRRARSLRRFALAMRWARVPGGRCLTIRVGEDGAGTHCHVAASPSQRLQGIGAVPPGGGLLLAGRSVHGFGLDRPLRVVGLDERGTVVAVRLLDPGRLVVLARARYLLELPDSIGEGVEVGQQVTAAASVQCSHARDALRVRNADRKPR